MVVIWAKRLISTFRKSVWKLIIVELRHTIANEIPFKVSNALWLSIFIKRIYLNVFSVYTATIIIRHENKLSVKYSYSLTTKMIIYYIIHIVYNHVIFCYANSESRAAMNSKVNFRIINIQVIMEDCILLHAIRSSLPDFVRRPCREI